MSRLESFIRRMCAQRDILDALVEPLGCVPGAILEFGLGSGRTYDHLRTRFPARRIVVFEREFRDGYVPDPPPTELVRGDIRDTAARMADGCAALVHADIDTGRPVPDADILLWLPALAARLLTPGGVVASSVALHDPRLIPMPVPASVSTDRYHLARRAP